MLGLAFHLIVYTTTYTLLTLYLRPESISSNSLYGLTFLVTLFISAIFNYTWDWKVKLNSGVLTDSQPLDQTQLGTTKEVSDQVITEASVLKFDYPCLCVFIPLVGLYVGFKLLWLYFRILLYTLIDAGFDGLTVWVQCLVSVDWSAQFKVVKSSLVILVDTLAYHLTPLFTLTRGCFPLAFTLIIRLLTYLLCCLSRLTALIKKVLWVELAQPVMEEFYKGLVTFYLDIQPQMVRLERLFVDYLTLVTSDIFEEIQCYSIWCYRLILSWVVSVNYPLLLRALRYFYAMVYHYAQRILKLSTFEFKLLLEKANQSITHYWVTEVVEWVLTLPHCFPLLHLWAEEISNLVTVQVPQLLLNILVWLLEDVLIPGSGLLILAHQRAWKQARITYASFKRTTLVMIEMLDTVVMVPLVNLLPSLQGHLRLIYFFLVTMLRCLNDVAVASQHYRNFSHIKFWVWLSMVSAYCTRLALKICQSQLPPILDAINQYQERLRTPEAYTPQPHGMDTIGRRISLALAPSARFMAIELQFALGSLINTLEAWVTEQTLDRRRDLPTPKADPLKPE